MDKFCCDYCSCESTGHSIQYGICRGSPFCHECGTKMKWQGDRFICECIYEDTEREQEQS